MYDTDSLSKKALSMSVEERAKLWGPPDINIVGNSDNQRDNQKFRDELFPTGPISNESSTMKAYATKKIAEMKRQEKMKEKMKEEKMMKEKKMMKENMMKEKKMIPILSNEDIQTFTQEHNTPMITNEEDIDSEWINDFFDNQIQSENEKKTGGGSKRRRFRKSKKSKRRKNRITRRRR